MTTPPTCLQLSAAQRWGAQPVLGGSALGSLCPFSLLKEVFSGNRLSLAVSPLATRCLAQSEKLFRGSVDSRAGRDCGHWRAGRGEAMHCPAQGGEGRGNTRSRAHPKHALVSLDANKTE